MYWTLFIKLNKAIFGGVLDRKQFNSFSKNLTIIKESQLIQIKCFKEDTKVEAD